jgi:flavin-dependent dehydrogenase
VNCHTERIELLRAGGADRLERLIRSIAPDLHERLRGAERTSPIRGTRGIPSFKRQPAGPGWLLVGDAGCTKDPISGHGISDAMASADLAAFHIDAALDGAPEHEAFEAFHVRRDDFVRDVYTSTARLARYDWSAEEAWGLQADIGDAWRNAALAADALTDSTTAPA